MKRVYHVTAISRKPETAQISNLQIKLEGISDIIDRILLADRQAPWKSTGPSGDATGTGTGTGTGTSTSLEL